MKKTINLLPKERKNNLKWKKFNLFLLKNGLIFVLATVVFLVFLISNLFILNIYKKINQDEIKKEESSGLNKTINEAKKEIDEKHMETEEFLKVFSKGDSYWVYLDEINQSLPEEVYFKELNLDKENLEIKGWSETRNDLLKFEESLKQKEIFKEIEMPISNLTSQENINFEIIVNLQDNI